MFEVEAFAGLKTWSPVRTGLHVFRARITLRSGIMDRNYSTTTFPCSKASSVIKV